MSVLSISALIIVIACLWANFTDYIRDGIIGKAIIFLMALGAFGIFAKESAQFDGGGISEVTLLCALAAYWVRHAWIHYVYRKVQRWYYMNHPDRDRRENCKGCLGTNLDGTRRGKEQCCLEEDA